MSFLSAFATATELNFTKDREKIKPLLAEAYYMLTPSMSRRQIKWLLDAAEKKMRNPKIDIAYNRSKNFDLEESQGQSRVSKIATLCVQKGIQMLEPEDAASWVHYRIVPKMDLRDTETFSRQLSIVSMALEDEELDSYDIKPILVDVSRVGFKALGAISPNQKALQDGFDVIKQGASRLTSEDTVDFIAKLEPELRMGEHKRGNGIFSEAQKKAANLVIDVLSDKKIITAEMQGKKVIGLKRNMESIGGISSLVEKIERSLQTLELYIVS